MPRRRPPSLRRTNSTTAAFSSSSSSSSCSSMRRNTDTKNLITATNVFGGQEVGGMVRAILLGAFIGGLVIFLFYPDISGLLEQWHNSSEAPGFPWTSIVKKDSSHSEDAKLQSVSSNKENNSPPQKTAKGREKAKKSPKLKTKTKQIKKVMENLQEPDSFCPCTCQEEPVTLPPECQPPPAKKPKASKKAKSPREDLMEEEEIVEEDPVEVELMEEEEGTDFIDLDPDEDPASASSLAREEGSETTVKEVLHDFNNLQASPHTDEELSSKNGYTYTRNDGSLSSEDTQAGMRKENEPLVLTDGQPITFTPVNSGDKNFISVGGRPKPSKEPSTQAHTKQNSSAKSSASEPQAGTANTNRSPQHSESGSMKKSSGGRSREDADSSSEGDLPDEVRNFEPTFLKTVMAKKIFADGRRIPPVELLPQKETNSSVRVFLFNEFLSEAECEGLRRVHDKHVQNMATDPLLCFDSLSTLRKHLNDVKRNIEVTPKDFVAGTKCLNGSFSRQLGGWLKGNWSYSTAFYPGESRFSTVFAARVHHAMGLLPSNGGKFQITSYPTGKAYKAHTDCVLKGTDPRDRVATVLVYLDDVEDGGETKFPELGIWVKPRKGRALVWNNMSPQGHCEPHSLHVASKVNSGSKYILIRWYYYKSFYSLGKRPPEPPIPARDPGTPRVSCDDYDNGSCRWYDEWNNDHLLDYEYNKYTFI